MKMSSLVCGEYFREQQQILQANTSLVNGMMQVFGSGRTPYQNTMLQTKLTQALPLPFGPAFFSLSTSSQVAKNAVRVFFGCLCVSVKKFGGGGDEIYPSSVANHY